MRPSTILISCLVLAAAVTAVVPAATADGTGASSEAGRGSEPQSVPGRAAAGGATVVGSNDGDITGVSCIPAASSWVQYGTSPSTPSYTVPGAGVITSYSHRANAKAGSIRATWYGPAASPDDRTVVSTSALLPVTPNTLNTWPVRIPVPALVVLGIFVNIDGMACETAGHPATDVTRIALVDPSTDNQFTPITAYPSYRVNLSAVWEPDVDGDTFGDVSQDACPQSKLTQAACPPPGTTITKAPRKKSTKRKGKIKFSSTVAGSTFTCAVDGKAAVPCTSPFIKKFKYGKHTVLITATSPVGVVDSTPTTVTFRVKRPRSSGG